MEPSQSIRSLLLDATPESEKFHPIIWKGFLVFHMGHKLWHFHRKAKTYTNPENLLNLVAGHTLSHFVGNNKAVRIAARCILVAARLQECVKEQAAIQEEARKVWDAILGRHLYHLYGLKNQEEEIRRVRLERICFHLAEMFRRIGLLSLKIMDVVEAFQFGPATQKEAVEELFVNIGQCVDEIVDNKEKLRTFLEDEKELVKKVLDAMQFDCTVEQLQNYLETSTHVVEQVHNAIKGQSKDGVNLFAEGAKDAIFGAAAVIGAESIVPTVLIPESEGVFLHAVEKTQGVMLRSWA